MRRLIGIQLIFLLTGLLFSHGVVRHVLGFEPQASGERDKASAQPLSGIVVDDQSAPLEGADVVYSWWTAGKSHDLHAKSDQQGRFVLQPPQSQRGGAWPTGRIWAGVSGRRLTQKPLFEDGTAAPAEGLQLVLPPPSNVPIAVRGPDGKAVEGAQIKLPVFAVENNGSALLPEALIPLTKATTDQAGEARLTALDRDEIREVSVTTAEHGGQSRYFGASQRGDTQPLTISLRAAGRVRGRLVASDPELASGITVHLLAYPSQQQTAEQTLGSALAVSDKQGRFEVPALAEGVIRHISVERKVDRPFLPVSPKDVAIGAGKTVELEIPFKPAVHVRGLVREADAGKPLPEVMIALWEAGDGSSASAATDEDGRFEFWRLPGQVNAYLMFAKPREAPGWFVQHFYQIPGGKEDFELPPFELTLAQGRVVDGAGRAVSGAKIEKVVTKIEVQGQPLENPATWSSQRPELLTDANGEYRAWVEAGAAYRVQVLVEGRAPLWTEWTEFRGNPPSRFPDIVIGSLRSIAGRIVDRQGRAVVGATIIQSGDGPQRTETAADQDGRFQLAGYQNDAGFVFAEKDGFRFHGQAVKAGDDKVQIVLVRTSEPPERLLATLPEADAAGETALAIRVLTPALDRAPKNQDDRDWRQVMQELSLVDPAAALDRLDASGFKGEVADMLRVNLAKEWSQEHPDDAMAIIEALDDAYSRAAGYVVAAEALPASLRDRKLEWLGKAQFHLRGATDPTMRMALSAYIARLLAENGKIDDARKIIAEIKPEVEKLPLDSVSAYVRGVTAEALAALDLPAALALLKDLKDDGEYDRHHGNVARILATSNPAEALRVLKLVRDDFQRDQRAVYVAFLMAPLDQARASGVIELIGSLQLQALAEGLTAQALSQTDANAAMTHLERAYETLAKLAASEAAPTYGYHAAPVLAAWFLPIVDAIEPDRVEEFLWRAIALRAPLAKQGDRERPVLLTRAYLAMFLSRYDRDLARGLYGNLAAEAAARLGAVEFAGAAQELYAAAALVEPSRAVDLYDKLSADSPANALHRARGGLVDILSRHGDARWRAASGYLRMPMLWHGIE